MRALVAVLLVASFAGCVSSRDAPGTERGSADPAAVPPPQETTLAVATAAPYSYAPATLTAKAGARVNLTYANDDPLPIQRHDWVLDEAGAATEVLAVGASETISFVAPAAGTYEFYCSVGNHRELGMRGTFSVT